MSKEKFSPGEWICDNAHVHAGKNCIISQKGWETIVEAKANANLIAAAPKLYEALKGAVQEACGTCAMMHVNPDTYDFVEKGCPFIVEHHCDYRDCIAILRKARGESEADNGKRRP